jgi:16S rRNA processing protein RimM
VSETIEIDYPDLTWLGTIVGPHGVQGELKVYPLTDDPNFYCKSLKYFLRENAKGFEKINIKNLKIHKGIWILKCRECGGRNLAESWKKSRLLVNDGDLRPLGDDEVFLHQIKGAIVVDSLEKMLGEVVEIIETGAGYVYSVKQPNGREFLVPSLGNIVQFFDIQNKKLIIDPIPGLLES